MRFKVTIEYDGTEYHGWQVQPNGRTIQAVLQEAVARMSGEAAVVVAAGRTDAGVHACGQVISFALQRPVSTQALRGALNALTPPDISITAAEAVGDDFHPRRAARSRIYAYRIWNARWASPFWRRYAWHVPRELDCEQMRAAAAHLLGDHDFTSFQAAGCEARQPVRRVLRSDLDHSGHLVIYTIEATGFLRHMVRNIVGTLVDVGLHKLSVGRFKAILASRDRALASGTAPAQGLFLVQVFYD
jgi:tRNA pseudouridine38-40 synthase